MREIVYVQIRIYVLTNTGLEMSYYRLSRPGCMSQLDESYHVCGRGTISRTSCIFFHCIFVAITAKDKA